MVAERAQEASRCLKNFEENFLDNTCNLDVLKANGADKIRKAVRASAVADMGT